MYLIYAFIVRVLIRKLSLFSVLFSLQMTIETLKQWIKLLSVFIYIYNCGDTCGAMVIFIRNKHGEPSSNPGQGFLHFT